MSSTQLSIFELVEKATKYNLHYFLEASLLEYDEDFFNNCYFRVEDHRCCGICYISGAHYIESTKMLGAICFWAKENCFGAVQFVIREDENPEKFLSWFKDLNFVSTVEFYNPNSKRNLYLFTITL